jgi:hypothetical protein
MFTYYEPYQVLLCCEHRCAVYGLDKHLKRHHSMPAAERRALLATYEDLHLVQPAKVRQPAPYSRAINELGPAQDAFLCCYPGSRSSSSSSSSRSNSRDRDRIACSYISTSRAKMRQHVNQQHQIKLTRWSSAAAVSYEEHAAQLWRPVKVQTFFRERRYVRYFVVQEQKEQGEQHAEQQGDEQQGDEQQGDEQQGDEQQGDKQRLALLSSKWEALKREDSKAMNRIAEDASAKDRTGWFKRTRWDEHLQAYPDWKLLAYTIRLPGDDEPALKQVVLAVEELVEQAVHGLSTLSIETLRWLRSAKPNEADARPLGRMQNKSSQQRAARLWARLLCYCVRLVAAEEADEAEEEEQQQRRQKKKPPLQALVGIARLFPYISDLTTTPVDTQSLPLHYVHPLPSVSPHQNLRLLPLLTPCRTQRTHLCVQSIFYANCPFTFALEKS